VSAPRLIPDSVLELQAAASDPAASAWVAANAGAGKTHVLAQRVIRLLLGGVAPEKILCITFTKAAAANMAKRVFDCLAEWATFDEDKLDDAIQAISGTTPDASLRARARRLFARAIETPGGLKVETIHAFCTRVLQQFPFEANVAARFDVLDATGEAQLLDKVSLSALLEAAAQSESALGRALTTAVASAADQTFRDAIREAMRKREVVQAWIAQDGSIESAIGLLCGVLGISSDDSVEAIDTETTEGPFLPSSRWPAAANVLAQGSKNDRGQAESLRAAFKQSGEERADIYRGVFLTGNGEPKQRPVTGTIATIDPPLAEAMYKERDRVVALAERRKAVLCRGRTAALITIADAVISRYQAEKDRRGLLDYDDLINRTLGLLQSVDSAWVHYKLDAGVDHVLIDEAQDTSPNQWRIVRALVDEFFAGAGARDAARTVFAVGDEKQSIFSFQGAAPREFDKMRRAFATACQGIERDLRYLPFRHSFRSGPNILGAVDTVFGRPEAFTGLSAENVATVHESLPGAAPGLVEVWETTKPEPKRDMEAWDAPFDAMTETSAQTRLAQRIARNIGMWMDRGTRPGDVLILVRQRGPLFEAIIRALKDAGIAVAGADRLVLTEHIAVMDLIVLADALLLPGDDLAVATVLKSPLFVFDDSDLFDIAWRRTGSLRGALRRDTRERFVEASRKLDRLAESALRDTPFAFYAGLLGPEGGRRQFLMRLGQEADDALDEFLNLALDYERREPPSLQGFVAWLRAANAEIKRDMEIARDEVRVMTVHGAKGLEASVVILADTTTPPAGPPQRQPKLLGMTQAGEGPDALDYFAWAAAKATDSNAVSQARARARTEAENEHRRLLYVAMTRAVDRLVVCGFDGRTQRPEGCWYNLVYDALAPHAVKEPAEDGEGCVWRYRKETGGPQSSEPAAVAPLLPRIRSPDWLGTEAPREAQRYEPLSPSSAFDESHRVRTAGAGTNREKALARGESMHRLLQSLPDILPQARADAARRFMARRHEFDDEERTAMIEQVLAILDKPSFRDLFQLGSRAEVPIVGRLELGERSVAVSGQVDRLSVNANRVLIADYKTNRPAPERLEDAPPAYVTQLALYRAVLGGLYPNTPIQAALVWTEIPHLMEIPPAAMDQALARLTAR
jgi:ATP-dependent helicase/nuclease subunit A